MLYFLHLATKYNTSNHALPLLGLCSAKSQCHVTRSTKYVTAQNACLHSAEAAVQNVLLSVWTLISAPFENRLSMSADEDTAALSRWNRRRTCIYYIYYFLCICWVQWCHCNKLHWRNIRLLFRHPDEWCKRYQSAINECIKFTLWRVFWETILNVQNSKYKYMPKCI